MYLTKSKFNTQLPRTIFFLGLSAYCGKHVRTPLQDVKVIQRWFSSSRKQESTLIYRTRWVQFSSFWFDNPGNAASPIDRRISCRSWAPLVGDSYRLRLRKNNDRDGITLTTGSSLHVHGFQGVDSRQNFDANQSNQSYVRSRTLIPRTTYACTSGISGYIKRVQ